MFGHVPVLTQTSRSPRDLIYGPLRLRRFSEFSHCMAVELGPLRCWIHTPFLRPVSLCARRKRGIM